MAGKKTLEISLVDSSLALQYFDNDHLAQPIEYYPVNSIKGIIGVPIIAFATKDANNQRKNPYGFDDMLKIQIYLEGETHDLSFDIQQVTNQPGWTANLAGLDQALADINAWTATVVNVSVSGADETDNTPVASLEFLKVGGKAVDPAALAAYAIGDAVVLNSDLVGRLLTNSAVNTTHSVFASDSTDVFWELRYTWNPTTNVWDVEYYDADGAVGVPTGALFFSAEFNIVKLQDIEAVLAGISGFLNKDGSVALTDSITSTSTTFVNGTTIDLAQFQTISIVPEVTAAAGTTAYYRIQWSMDGVNDWFDETIDVAAAIAANESLISQGTMIRQFPSAATGVKTISAITLTKRAAFVRISQRSDAAVTVTTTYNYQLLKYNS